MLWYQLKLYQKTEKLSFRSTRSWLGHLTQSTTFKKKISTTKKITRQTYHINRIIAFLCFIWSCYKKKKNHPSFFNILHLWIETFKERITQCQNQHVAHNMERKGKNVPVFSFFFTILSFIVYIFNSSLEILFSLLLFCCLSYYGGSFGNTISILKNNRKFGLYSCL